MEGPWGPPVTLISEAPAYSWEALVAAQKCLLFLQKSPVLKKGPLLTVQSEQKAGLWHPQLRSKGRGWGSVLHSKLAG